MLFKVELVVKLYAKDVEVLTSEDSPGSTSDKILSFVRIQYHAPVIAPLLNHSEISGSHYFLNVEGRRKQ